MTDQGAGSLWVENLLRPVLIAAMMVCLAVPFVKLLEALMTGWDGTYFLVFCFFAGLEGILSERALRKRRVTGWGYLGSRAAELLILLLVLKLVSYVPIGLGRLWADALTWPSDPYGFVSTLDLLLAVVFVSLWVGALLVGRRVSELDVDEAKPPPPPDKSSSEYYLWLTRPPRVRFYQESLNWLGEMYLWGGIIILIASAALHFFVPTTGVLALPTLLYFALGVALLSQAGFGVAHASWRAQGIPIQAGIGRRWLLWVLVFLLAVSLVALLLPTEYAMGPALALLSLFGIVAQVMMLIVTMAAYLLAVLLSLLLPGMEQPVRPPLGLEQVPFSEQAVEAAKPQWLEVLMSALFWTLILAIVGYALFRFLRDRAGLLERGEGAELTLWGRLLAWLRNLWRQWWTWQHEVQERLARRRVEHKEEGVMAALRSRFFSLRRLPPRELVRYFYLSATRRAAQAGQARRPGQTPYEYQVALDGAFPELEPDLTGLTDAFVRARYSQELVQEEDAEEVKPLWQRIKAALRRRRTGA